MAKQFDLSSTRSLRIAHFSLARIYDLFLFEDNDTLEIKKQITWYASLVGLVCALSFTIILFFSANNLDFFVALFATGAAVFSLLLLRRNQVEPAMTVLIVGALVATWVACFVQGGLYDVGIQTIYPVLILVFVLYPWRMRLLFGLLIIASVCALTFLETRGFYEELGDPYAPVVTGIDIVSTMALAMLLIGFVIHKLERVNQKLESTKGELQVLMAEKDLLLEMLTHDMKSPLTAISLYAEKIKRDPAIVQQQPRIAVNLLKSQKALSELVENIIDVEQLKQTGQLMLKSEDFNLLEALEDSIQFVEEHGKEKNIAILMDCSASAQKEIVINGDQRQLRRAFTNLLSNAVKYSPAHTQVTIRVTEADGGVRLSVEDQGYGIPADEIPSIFDLYSRATSNIQKASGNGIGLAIVKGIIEQHGGQITAESEVSKGSCFTINLPKST